MAQTLTKEAVRKQEQYDTAMENRAELTTQIREKIRDVVNPYFDARDELATKLSEAKFQRGRGAAGLSALASDPEQLQADLEEAVASNPFATVAPETGVDPGVAAQLDREMGIGAICIKMHSIVDGRISTRPVRVYYISENQPDEVHEMDPATYELTRHEIGGERVDPFDSDVDHLDTERYSRKYMEAAQAFLACAGAIESQQTAE